MKRFTEKDGLVNNNVLSMARSDSLIWMATLGGVCSFSMRGGKPVFTTYNQSTQLGNGYIYCVSAVPGSDSLWLGTDGNGLATYSKGSFSLIRSTHKQCGKNVVAIALDEQHRVWFYSTDAGLQSFDGKTIQSIRLTATTEGAEVFALQYGGNDDLVVLTSHGIVILNTAAKVDRLIYEQQGTNANYLNTIALDNRSTLWLATEDAMIRYNRNLASHTQQPKTVLEAMEVNLQPADTSQHHFKSRQNQITFTFGALWWKQPDALQYQYYLEGFDTRWNNTAERTANYARVPPGTYTFYVRSSTGSNWQGSHTISYTFTIAKPFVQTIWFYLLAGLLTLGLIILIYRLRLNSIRKREAAHRQRLQSQFETLRNQVNPHFLFNSFNTLISIISKDKNVAVDYVEKLSDYFRFVLEQRDKEVITVKEELELVNKYIFLQQKRFFENLMVNITLSDAVLQSMIPPMTLQLLIENAIKHNIISKTKPLQIMIRNSSTHIEVCNNLQKKLTSESSTGIGLNNIRSR